MNFAERKKIFAAMLGTIGDFLDWLSGNFNVETKVACFVIQPGESEPLIATGNMTAEQVQQCADYMKAQGDGKPLEESITDIENLRANDEVH